MQGAVNGNTTTWPADTQIGDGLVVVPGANPSSVKLPAAAGATGIIGVTDGQALGNALNGYEVAVKFSNVARCRSLTGTAIAVGDSVKVADTAGRVTKLTVKPGSTVSAGVLTGQVGIAFSIVASGDPTDTWVYVLLTPGANVYA